MAFESDIPDSLDDGQTGPGFPIEVFNVLGAGDGFFSGLLKGWLDGEDSSGDVVCVPRGHHPCGAPYGFEMYYLNVMAGPLRKWRFIADPAVQWIMDRDA